MTGVLLTLAVAGCSHPAEAPVAQPAAFAPVVGAFEPTEVPALPGSGQPYVAADSGRRFLLSWTEPAGEKHALRMSTLEGDRWSEPISITVRDDLFVNWADFPSVIVSGDAIYAHWLQRSAPGTYNYDVVMSISTDQGASWGEPFVVHDDGVMAEHGFASMLPLPESRIGVAWLDGRDMVSGHDEGMGDMSLRYAEISPDGTVTNRAPIDSRTCECCATTIVSTPTGPLVAWRDRSETEVRDIFTSRLLDGAWTEPVRLHEDGWHIEGCPVNGPQADAVGERVVIAWFIGASDEGVVNVAFSTDGGVTFADPIVMAVGGGVVGYVDAIFVSGDRAFVTWMEDKPDRLELVGREVSSSGEMGDATVLGTTSRGRTGFPRMARSGDQILLAWNEKGDSPGIRAARAMIAR